VKLKGKQKVILMLKAEIRLLEREIRDLKIRNEELSILLRKYRNHEIWNALRGE